ncbi:hypothetical protein [Rhizobium phage RHEph24]|nr:hypothetical protein [Rhizobium phage RHEph24]
MSESKLKYLSPIFYRGEVPFDCTINVYRGDMDRMCLVKSRYSKRAHAILEAPKLWGVLQYRINVRIKHAVT